MTTLDDIMTPQEVAELARISPATLSRLTKANKIPHTRISARIVRYQRSKIEAWIGKDTTERTNGQSDVR